jgi:DNA-binding MarR family transcriptional regulator
LVRLTPAGRALVQKIAPLARAREAFLLEPLSADERAALERALTLLGQQAQRLTQQG